MIGFAGYAFYEPEAPRQLLGRMAKCFEVDERRYHTVFATSTEFGLCATARKGESVGLARSSDDNIILAVVPCQFAPSELGHGLNMRDPETVATYLLQLYRTKGVDALLALNGRYALAIWDQTKATLSLINDELGMRRFCWRRTSDVFLFSTEYKTFMEVPKADIQFDDLGVAEFFAVGYPMEQRTLLKNIQLLPPSSCLSATCKRHTIKTNRFVPPPLVENRSLNECADQIGEILDEVISEYASTIDGPLILPLSGGLDARTILGFAVRAGIKEIHTYTFGHRHCYDVRYGAQLGKSANSSHHYIHLPQSYIKDFGKQEIVLTEGEIAARYFYYAILKDTISPGGMLWSGFLGDTLSGGHLSDFAPSLTENARIQRLYRQRYNGPWGSRRQWTQDDVIGEVIRTPYQSLFDKAPLDTVHSLVTTQEGDSFAHREMSTEIFQRQRRFTVFQLDSLAQHFSVIAPFYDRRVIDAFYSIPEQYLYGQKAYRRMITRFLPALAKIPDTKSCRPITESKGHIFTATQLQSMQAERSFRVPASIHWRLNRAGNRAGNLLAQLSGGWLGNHHRGEYTHPDQIIRQYPDLLADTFHQGDLLEPYFSQKKVEELLKRHVHGECNADPILYKIWTFACWQAYLRSGGVT